jgi:hypothetical protein
MWTSGAKERADPVPVICRARFRGDAHASRWKTLAARKMRGEPGLSIKKVAQLCSHICGHPASASWTEPMGKLLLGGSNAVVAVPNE